MSEKNKPNENKPTVFKDTGLSVIKSEPKEEKPKSMFDEIQEEMLTSTVEALLPKIKPFIKPAVAKFVEFLGDNEKTIVIRRLKDGSPTVFIFDNKIGNYEIKNDSKTNVSVFTGSRVPSPIKDIYDVNIFIEKLLTGELLKELSNKDK